MSDAKTVPTDVSVETFIDAVVHAGRRDDARVLLDRMREWTGLQPQMWGESIIGFGRYKYIYESGCSGTWMLTAFSPRKANMVVYIMPGFEHYGSQLERLGKHKHSVSCLYLGRLASIDLDVLGDMVTDSVARMKAKYPAA